MEPGDSQAGCTREDRADVSAVPTARMPRWQGNARRGNLGYNAPTDHLSTSAKQIRGYGMKYVGAKAAWPMVTRAAAMAARKDSISRHHQGAHPLDLPPLEGVP